mgnify:CR=1 FL=1
MSASMTTSSIRISEPFGVSIPRARRPFDAAPSNEDLYVTGR